MRAFATVLLWALTTSACMTAGMMERGSLTAGLPVIYAAHPDSLMAAARTALGDAHLAVHMQSRPDTATRMLIGSGPMTLFSYGELIRFVITATAPETSVVRVVSRSAYLLDLGHRNRAPSLLHALDAHVDPGAMLVPGVRIRLGGGGRGERVGDLLGWRHDSLVVQLDAGSSSVVALGDLARVSVLRGHYSHVREGAAVGLVLGVLVGIALAQGVSSSEWFYELERFSRVTASMTLGTLVGALLGSQVRTSVWSDVDVGRVRGR